MYLVRTTGSGQVSRFFVAHISQERRLRPPQPARGEGPLHLRRPADGVAAGTLPMAHPGVYQLEQAHPQWKDELVRSR